MSKRSLSPFQFTVPDEESAQRWGMIGMQYRGFVQQQLEDMKYKGAVDKQKNDDAATEKEVTNEQASAES